MIKICPASGVVPSLAIKAKAMAIGWCVWPDVECYSKLDYIGEMLRDNIDLYDTRNLRLKNCHKYIS